MTRWNTTTNRPAVHGPVTTTGEETQTFEGGAAYVRDAKSDLLLLAVTNMVGQDTFYENAQSRDDRYSSLVRQVAVRDGQWMAGFLTWLRGSANMRSASLVGAAEAVKARLEHTAALSLSPGPHSVLPTPLGWNRLMVDAVLQRADEPGEFLAYWTQKYGRKLPQPVKRGVADAARRLYSQYSLLKYDTPKHGFRFGDVLELTHPAPDAGKPWQGDLFQHALDRRHNPTETEVPESLRTVRQNEILRASAAVDMWLEPERLKAAGMTWEDVLSAKGGDVDKRKLWEAVIPSMGYMALLRNLRNFDEAGVSDALAALVAQKLMDSGEVARSRQFPYRFLSAQKEVPSQRWGHALDVALGHSVSNIPAFPGRTLVLVDTSASMTDTVSRDSKIRHVDIAALFGVVLAARGANVDLHGFAGQGMGGPVQFRHNLVRGGSVLRQCQEFIARIGEVGHGTRTIQALRETYKQHDRVVIFSDMQAFRDWGSGLYGGHGSVSNAVPAEVPMFGFNTTGYGQATLDTRQPNRHEVGGFSDKMFTVIDLLSRGRDASWPWEQ